MSRRNRSHGGQRQPRPPSPADELSRAASRTAANLITDFGRRHPRGAAVVLVLALVLGLTWYWREQTRQSRESQTTTQAPAPPPLPPPRDVEVPPVPAPEQAPPDATIASGEVRRTSPAVSPHLLLGNPSGATTDPSNRGNYLLVKPHYALSYNDAKGTPNWVSWRVTAADLGDAPRKREFDPEALLPPGVQARHPP